MGSMVERTTLAAGLGISRIVTGLWQIADMERDGRRLDRDQLAKQMKAYAASGLTTFDMADHYGSAEEIAGLFASQYADNDVQCLTKWVPEPGQSSKDAVDVAVHRALDRLQTERLDLLQYHAWNYADPAYLDDLFHLQALKEKGLIRHIGLTNFDTTHLSLVLESGIEVVSNQVCFSMLDQRAAYDMTALCADKGIKLLAFGTLAGGFLTEKWLDRPEPAMNELETWSQMKYRRYIETAGGWSVFQALLTTLRQVADKHGVSMANVASRFILEQPAVAAVIIGARLGDSDHVNDNIALMSLDLDNADRQQLNNAIDELSPIPGDCGDEYRKPPYLTASGDLSHHLDELPAPYPTKPGADGRLRVLSGTVWEDLAGFSRAVQKGDRIMISGTTATHGDRIIGGTEPAAQTHFIIDKIEGALQSLGGRLEDVVRTRVYIRNIDDWEAVSRAHGKRFGDIQPANTLVQAGLIGDGYLVEIDAEAIVTELPLAAPD